MKFVIEAAGLTVAGGKELALDLMTRLAGHVEHQFTFIVPDLAAYQSISGGNIRTRVCPKESGLLHRERLLNDQVPRICREEGADALLCLGNFVPRRRVCPTAVLLQNAWIVYRDPVAESRRTLRERLITAYGRHAYRHLGSDVAVVTQTTVMRDRLCRKYGITPQRVTVIPNGLSHSRLGATPARHAGRPNEDPNPFTFLCLAHCYPHKNIAILADAVRILPKYTLRPAQCVITVAPEQHPGARRLLERLGQDELEGKIENIGPVASAKLAQVYARADALVFPTLLESFSRTYLEAWHFGLPILTSDRDFAHHLCGDAALYFDPLDAASVARAMAAVMEDSKLRQTMVETGRSILAQAPGWDEIAGRFVEVLEGAAGSGQGAEGRRQKAEGSKQVGSGQWAGGQVGSGQVEEGSRQQAEGSEQAGSGENSTAGSLPADPRGHLPTADLPTAFRLLPSAFLRLPSAFCLLPSAFFHLPTAHCQPPAADVRTLFNQMARRWRSKYGPHGKLNSRLARFTERLAELCPPPAEILDLGCGTGEIAAAVDRMRYRVTACDLAEEMIAIARRSHNGAGVKWVSLESGSKRLPFADRSFDGILASSVFEYLEDLPGTTAELARVLRPDGILLLTVPNPCHAVRKLEARLQSLGLFDRLLRLFGSVPRLNSYAAYLELSRNRFAAPQWQSVLDAARFAPLDARDFSPEAWQRQAKAPLVLLAVKRETP